MRAASAYFGGSSVPDRALTVGMAHLIAARHVLLLVSGRHKQEILERTLRGPMTPEVPASWLRLAPSVMVVADREAFGNEELVR